MSGFDKVYNDQCARLWNPDPASPLTFEVHAHGYSMGYYVIAKREGLGIGQGGTFKTKEEATAYRDQLQREYENGK